MSRKELIVIRLSIHQRRLQILEARKMKRGEGRILLPARHLQTGQGKATRKGDLPLSLQILTRLTFFDKRILITLTRTSRNLKMQI
ncbi:MAG: hypothetical protein HY787_22255 [Deltaproteobacteria bacterium]|nr:hypothetical protein [Deltaproteobacteria bacterium]